MNFISTLEKTSFPSSQHWQNGQGRMRVQRRGKEQDGGYRQPQHQQNSQWHAGHSYNIICQWEPFKKQVLLQWDRLAERDLDAVGPNRSKIAVLIESKYGIAAHLVENYLRNFERTLPLI